MNVLVDSHISPLQALVFNYSTFRFISLLINNLCTWLAAITFWKIRSTKPELLHLPDCRVFDEPDPIPELLDSDAVSTEPACVSTLVVGNGCYHVGGVTKGKFTVYYEDDGECGNDDVLDVTEKWEEREGISNDFESEWCESWEILLRLKKGENKNGWYTCQDLTELNGNIVRLWDGDEFRFWCHR